MQRNLLKVYGWTGYRTEAGGQTREIVAAPSQAAAARAAGVARPRALFCFCETGNASEIDQAMARPGTVLWRQLDAGAAFVASPASPARRRAPVSTGKPPPGTPGAPGLLPCPCCGGAAKFAEGEHGFADVKVRCTACDLESGLVETHGRRELNRAGAAVEWNRRTLPPAHAEVVRRAVEVLELDAKAMEEATVRGDGTFANARDRAACKAARSLASRLRALLPPR